MNTSDAARALAKQRKTHGAGSGRPKKPTPCPRCGVKCAGAREAWAHCLAAKAKG